jgi:hypothetical protein
LRAIATRTAAAAMRRIAAMEYLFSSFCFIIFLFEYSRISGIFLHHHHI